MTSFCMKRLVLKSFRCFDALDLALEDDLTILFAAADGAPCGLEHARSDHA